MFKIKTSILLLLSFLTLFSIAFRPHSAFAAPNLIQNPGFETWNGGSSSFSSWTFSTTSPAVGDLDVGSPIGGAQSAKIDVDTASTDWHIQLQQTNIPVVANTTYVVSFWTKSGVSRNIGVRIQQAASPYTTRVNQTVAVPVSSGTRHTFTFTPTTTENVLLAFNVAQTTGTIWLDDVSLTTQNLIQNPGFESWNGGFSSWTFSTTSPAVGDLDVGSPSGGAQSAKIDVDTTSTTDWHIQLQQTSLPVTAGQTYTVSFWARSTLDRTMGVRIQQAASPYTTRTNQSITVPDEAGWAQYSFTFSPTVTENVLLAFNVAQTFGTVQFDDVSMIQN